MTNFPKSACVKVYVMLGCSVGTLHRITVLALQLLYGSNCVIGVGATQVISAMYDGVGCKHV